MEYTTNSLFKIAVRPSNKVGGTKNDWKYEEKELTAYNICKRFGAKWETVNKYNINIDESINEVLDAVLSEGRKTLDTGDKYYQFYYAGELFNNPGKSINSLYRHPDFEQKSLSVIILYDYDGSEKKENNISQRFIQRAKEKKKIAQEIIQEKKDNI